MKALVLKSVNYDGSAYGEFIWPESGKVICPDWNPEPVCGGGLHGLLWGEGNGALLNRLDDARWLVLEVESESIVDLGGKVKIPECEVIYSGERDVAVEMILERNPSAACCFARKAVGNFGKVIVGDYGEATAGDYGQATAGNYGVATVGYGGQATAGDYGEATVGDYGEATVGDFGQAIVGYGGIAITGKYGTAIVGDHGQAMVGNYGQAQCRKGGSISIAYYDEKRNRILTGYAGEDIEADVMYAVIDGKFVKF